MKVITVYVFVFLLDFNASMYISKHLVYRLSLQLIRAGRGNDFSYRITDVPDPTIVTITHIFCDIDLN